MRTLSKRGKLAGFREDEPRGLFSVAAHGWPFDRVLVADASEQDGGTTIQWSLTTPPLWPWLIGVTLAITVWPGLPLTDSVLRNSFTFYDSWTQGWLATWMWYLPVTIIPIPWTWKTIMTRMRATTLESAHEAVAKMAAAIRNAE